jgi:hypothetical protein
MQSTAEKGAATMPERRAEPTIGRGDTPHPVLRKRIGSTTYLVAVRFSETSKETMQDKILRLIEREVSENDA